MKKADNNAVMQKTEYIILINEWIQIYYKSIMKYWNPVSKENNV